MPPAVGAQGLLLCIRVIQGQLGGRRVASSRCRLAIPAEDMLEVDRGVGLARFAAHDSVHVDVRTGSLREDGFRTHAMRAAAAITTAAIAALLDRGRAVRQIFTRRKGRIERT